MAQGIALACFLCMLLAAVLCDGALYDNKLKDALNDASDNETFAVWVMFKQKLLTPINFENSQITVKEAVQYGISAETLARRSNKAVKSGVDYHDVPIPKEWINMLSALPLQIRTTSKWLNSASVTVTKENIVKLAQLPFIERLELVRRFLRVKVHNSSTESSKRDILNTERKEDDPLNYGQSRGQLDMIGVIDLHKRHLTGKGVLILVMDAGFNIMHEALPKGDDIVDTYNFVADTKNIQVNTHHGTAVLGLIGARKDGKLYGPAYESKFLLAKTEDSDNEDVIEEDYFARGLEWGESKGADMAHSSLGYSEWYDWGSYDGKQPHISRASDIAVSKGMPVVTSAGNSGFDSITAPTDAFNIISVGSVTPTKGISYFSSRGPTADGRIKPEVCAQGTNPTIAKYDGGYGTGSGTSFAGPLAAGVVALIIQAHPDWTPYQIREALMRTASHAESPNTDFGWGIVNGVAAVGYSFSEEDSCDVACKNGVCFAGECLCHEGYYNYNCKDKVEECSSYCETNCCVDNKCYCLADHSVSHCIPNTNYTDVSQCVTPNKPTPKFTEDCSLIKDAQETFKDILSAYNDYVEECRKNNVNCITTSPETLTYTEFCMEHEGNLFKYNRTYGDSQVSSYICVPNTCMGDSDFDHIKDDLIEACKKGGCTFLSLDAIDAPPTPPTVAPTASPTQAPTTFIDVTDAPSAPTKPELDATTSLNKDYTDTLGLVELIVSIVGLVVVLLTFLYFRQCVAKESA